MLLLLFILGFAVRVSLPLPEDLFKVSYLRKVLVAPCPPRLTLGIGIFGPKIVSQQLIRLRFEGFKIEQVVHRLGLTRGTVLPEHNLLGRLAGTAEGDAILPNSEIVFDRCAHG